MEKFVDQWVENTKKGIDCLSGVKLTPRRSHLFAVACCQSPDVIKHVTDKRLLETIAKIEGWIDGYESYINIYYLENQTIDAYNAIVLDFDDPIELAGENEGVDLAKLSECFAASAIVRLTEILSNNIPTRHGYLIRDARNAANPTGEGDELRKQGEILASIAWTFSDFSPEWRTEHSVSIARGIYREKAFDRMPILADSLEEAGCDDEKILIFLRGPGPFVRGNWVLDQLLNKMKAKRGVRYV